MLKTTPKIHFSKHPYANKVTPRFTIVVPTWNNLEMLQLCIKSLRKNSTYSHQLILHINEGTDGTKAWSEAQELSHTYSTENIGVCYALNAAVALASTDYIVYMNDDMYACPDWDLFLWEEIQKMSWRIRGGFTIALLAF